MAGDETIYKVVVNHEEQYSIWPAHRENPLGWTDAGKTGTKAEASPSSRRSGRTCARARCARAGGRRGDAR